MNKFCRDCKWFRRDIPFFLSSEFARCVNPKIMRTSIDYVAGKVIREKSFCSLERELWGDCHPDGKLFEAKD